MKKETPDTALPSRHERKKMMVRKAVPKFIGAAMILSLGGMMYFGFLHAQAEGIPNETEGTSQSPVQNKQPGKSAGIVSLKDMAMRGSAVQGQPGKSGTASLEDLLSQTRQYPAPQQLNGENFYINKIASYVEENTQDAADAPNKEADIVFFYSPGAVYKIYCREGFLTDIRLQPGEEILFIGGGDTVRWMVDKAASNSGNAKQWHIYLKPLKRGLETNLVITTDKHTYQLKAQSTNWYNPIIGWTYPQEERAAFIREQELEKQQEEDNIPVSAEKLNFRYKLSKKEGTYGWAPKMVFDDGVKTYIRMYENMGSAEAPALFIKEEKGKLALVNYRVRGNCYIVDRLFQEAELRSGQYNVVKIRRLD